MQKEIRIGKKIVSFNGPTFIVAELSANHKQDIELAKDTIYAIKESGADAVKLQTYTPDTITIDCKNQFFQITGGTLWDGRTLYELYQEAYTPWEWHYELKELAEKLGLVFFSTPFDKTAVDFLEGLDVPAYKIASYEITDIPLIEYVASKGKPILISTGVATLCDIQEAVEACKRVGNDQMILLKCVSAYPTSLEDVNLKTIPNMIETFGCIVGLSDHTLGISVPIAAVALGAKVIEKHFILSKDLDTPDKAFSLTPDEFKEMVKAIREVEIALGKVSYELSDSMKEARKYARSLFVVKDVKAGEVFTEENVRSVRPAGGLHPRFLKEVIGKKAKVNIKKGTPLNWNMID
ncbi:pseudaminic acid synthase [Thermovibrio guaymasensis]|uniref:Pseudaminic acid synthase n=1 Tax=Thermovibrio guaymasensis TaxID=240167 RepID=A0A420W9L9_9BACT|nr:pseudaminic acid synthase [Thermovibrio guaymasensis]RKQ64031.1 pseudaminic acid synthase [Thermovibrio guaymasensis]